MGRRLAAIAMVLAGGCATPDPSKAMLPYAIEAAQAQHRPLVIELYATWCKPCRIFEERVLTDPRVQEALRGVLFIRYDIDTNRGRDAMRRTRTRGVPAVLGIDHQGFIRVAKYGTEPTADEFLNFMRQAHQVLDEPAPPGAGVAR